MNSISITRWFFCVCRNDSLIKIRIFQCIFKGIASETLELWRQQVPANLPNLTRLLLARGADPKAVVYVYGGAYTAAELLATSVHPFRVGVGEETLQLLQ